MKSLYKTSRQPQNTHFLQVGLLELALILLEELAVVSFQVQFHSCGRTVFPLNSLSTFAADGTWPFLRAVLLQYVVLPQDDIAL